MYKKVKKEDVKVVFEQDEDGSLILLVSMYQKENYRQWLKINLINFPDECKSMERFKSFIIDANIDQKYLKWHSHCEYPLPGELIIAHVVLSDGKTFKLIAKYEGENIAKAEGDYFKRSIVIDAMQYSPFAFCWSAVHQWISFSEFKKYIK